jgi:hypothetical protein
LDTEAEVAKTIATIISTTTITATIISATITTTIISTTITTPTISTKAKGGEVELKISTIIATTILTTTIRDQEAEEIEAVDEEEAVAMEEVICKLKLMMIHNQCQCLWMVAIQIYLVVNRQIHSKTKTKTRIVLSKVIEEEEVKLKEDVDEAEEEIIAKMR